MFSKNSGIIEFLILFISINLLYSSAQAQHLQKFSEVVFLQNVIESKKEIRQEFTQDSSSLIKTKNGVYIEFFGSGELYSLNYERFFYDRISLRGGFTFLPKIDLGLAGHIGPGVILPLSTSLLFPMKKNELYFELGISGSFNFTEDFLGNFVSGIVGFRDQSFLKEGGYARLNVMPSFQTGPDNDFFITGGVSVGYKF